MRRIIFTLCAASLISFFFACTGQKKTEETYSNWKGKWTRVGAEITISNVTEKFLELSFWGFSGPHIGELKGPAFFTADNKAVLDYKDEYGDKAIKFEFVLDGDKLSISVTEGDETGIFGAGVYMSGVYMKNAQPQENSEINK